MISFEQRQELKEISKLLRCSVQDIPTALNKMISERKALEAQAAELRAELKKRREQNGVVDAPRN